MTDSFNLNEIEQIKPFSNPFDENEKIFHFFDPEREEYIGEPYSYNEALEFIKNISGLNNELLGN